MNAIPKEITKAQNDGISDWYAKATVRSTDRIIVPSSSRDEDIYPRSRQILSGHEIIKALGEPAVRYVLAQSTYKYMYEIGLLETRFVIDCALKIINGEIHEGATDDDRREAITVVIDEGYHAHVALDFIIQMKALSGVAPLDVPVTNRNLDAVRRTAAKLPPEMQNAFELVAVCLAEHTLTKDLLSIGREKDATVTFTQVMTDHVADESRHASYFSRMLSAYWAAQDNRTKATVGTLLPAHLDDYLAGDTGRLFDRKVMAAIGLEPEQVDIVLRDTNDAYLANVNEYIVKTKKNLVVLLQRNGVLSHPATRQAFVAHGLLT